MAYKLKLPDGGVIQPLIHVSQLKPFTPDYSLVYHKLPEIPTLEHRLVKKGNMAITKVLVQWSGLPMTSATWEDYSVLQNKFPIVVAWG
jgi:hypothetical protein